MSATSVSSPASSNAALQDYLNRQASTIASDKSPTSSGSASDTEAAIAKTWGNFNTFLTMITTQLKNQDPTNAADTNQFTQQLVQFAGVEQQISTNSKLDKLINLQKSSNGTAASLGYLGQYVEAPSGGKLTLQGGTSTIGYKLDTPMRDATITIMDSAGKVIKTIQGEESKGLHYVTWDGKDSSGNARPDGAYSFSVSATGTDGIGMSPRDMRVLGKVTGISTNNDGTSQLATGALSFNASKIDAVYAAGSLPST